MAIADAVAPAHRALAPEHSGFADVDGVRIAYEVFTQPTSPAGTGGQQHALVEVAAGLRRDMGLDGLTEDAVGHADHRRLPDPVGGPKHLLHLARDDLLAP